MTELQLFSQLILSRSKENQKAFSCLYENKLFGNCFSILRQELDSLMRIIFLLQYDDIQYRHHFINQTLSGEKWSFTNENGKKQNVTDKYMVQIASEISLFGWADCIYNFGCGFIHLSQLHSYGINNPFQMLSNTDKEQIIRYINQYHSANINHDSSLDDFIPYLPSIMQKVSGHVDCYTTDYILTQSKWDYM